METFGWKAGKRWAAGEKSYLPVVLSRRSLGSIHRGCVVSLVRVKEEVYYCFVTSIRMAVLFVHFSIDWPSEFVFSFPVEDHSLLPFVHMSSNPTARQTRSASATSTLTSNTDHESHLLDHLQSPMEFTQLFHQYVQSSTHRSSLIDDLCSIFSKSKNVDSKVLIFLLDCFISNEQNLCRDLSDLQFKQDLLPFIKRTLSTSEDTEEILLATLRCLIALIECRADLLTLTVAEWLSSVLHFVVTRISSTSYLTYGDLIIDLLTKIVEHFTPLPKEIVDVLGRSPSSIISSQFLTQLKTWVKHLDDTRLALFAIHLWQPLAALLSRLLTRGYTKGNEMLAIIQDAFVVGNYSIRGAAFSAWSSFMTHIYRSDFNLKHDDLHQQQLSTRLLKLFLTPFLPDNTSKSKSASIAKGRAWLVLLAAYPTHVDDVLLPFLAFAFGNFSPCKASSAVASWWPECRHIGAQYLHDLLKDPEHGITAVKVAGDQLLNYLFDAILEQLLDSTNKSDVNEESSLWLTSWKAYLAHLSNLFSSSQMISDQQHLAINTCLFTRLEQFWIDARVPTQSLLRLFEAFEQTSFPLAIETVLRDSSLRANTDPSSSSGRSTLSDQYLHLFLEHAVRYQEDNPSIADSYLRVISYLIETLSKTSDENFSQQTSALLRKCSAEFSLQPVATASLFWHIWLRCSTHLISILNRTRSVDFDEQRQETTMELLLRPFSFADVQRLENSYALMWTQLFRALCRLVLLDQQQSTSSVIQIYVQFLRHAPVLQQAIQDQRHQRLFGFLLAAVKTLLREFPAGSSDRAMSSSHLSKRSASSFTLCLTQLSTTINEILRRVLSDDDNTTQWTLVCYCLFKSNKTASDDQGKSLVVTYVRDLLVELFPFCKTPSHLELLFTQLPQLVPFLKMYELIALNNPSASISDHVLLTRILSTIQSVFEPSDSSTLLQLTYPLLIFTFQHAKTAIRNKARKCWNETFGRSTFLVYPNELR